MSRRHQIIVSQQAAPQHGQHQANYNVSSRIVGPVGNFYAECTQHAQSCAIFVPNQVKPACQEGSKQASRCCVVSLDSRHAAPARLLSFWHVQLMQQLHSPQPSSSSSTHLSCLRAACASSCSFSFCALVMSCCRALPVCMCGMRPPASSSGLAAFWYPGCPSA